MKQILSKALEKEGIIILTLGGVLGSALTFCLQSLINSWDINKNRKELQKKKFVGIQLGGTNYTVAIGEPILNRSGEIIDFRVVKKTNGITYEDPEQAIGQILNFIQSNQSITNNTNTSKQQLEQYEYIGIASFGPLCLNKDSNLYGTITTTPKIKWRNIDILNQIKTKGLAKRIGIDTDVNSCAYAEFKLGNHEAKQSLAYITVGTGVGVGLIVQGKTVHGLTHPEGGHITVERSKNQFQHFEGLCPFHKGQTCLESMVNNHSIASRLGIQFTALSQISDDDRIWNLVGYYLAQLCLNITLLVSPEVIVIGGGIMNRKILYNFIHQQFIKLLGGYVEHPLLSKNIAKYIVAPRLGSEVGVKGGMILYELDQ